MTLPRPTARLIACLLSIALGASAAFALPTDTAGPCARRHPTTGVRVECGQRRFNWRTFGEAMLPPVLRTRADTLRPTAGGVDSTPLVDEFESLSRLAHRVANRIS